MDTATNNVEVTDQNIGTEEAEVTEATKQTPDQILEEAAIEEARKHHLFLLRATSGDKNCKSEGDGARFTKMVFDDNLSEIRDDDWKKIKGKDLTMPVIVREFGRMTEEEFVARAKAAFQYVSAVQVLYSTKYQSPLRGGLTPRQVAENAVKFIRPESGVAQKETARQAIANSYSPKKK